MLWFLLAAAGELTGCYAFLRFTREHAGWLLAVSVACLLAFAWCLAKAPAPFAGRTYAAYGGLYIAAALAWLAFVDGARPDRWDLIGGALAILGALVILLGPRAATPPA